MFSLLNFGANKLIPAQKVTQEKSTDSKKKNVTVLVTAIIAWDAGAKMTPTPKFASAHYAKKSFVTTDSQNYAGTKYIWKILK